MSGVDRAHPLDPKLPDLLHEPGEHSSQSNYNFFESHPDWRGARRTYC
jgi:hypothetical protein